MVEVFILDAPRSRNGGSVYLLQPARHHSPDVRLVIDRSDSSTYWVQCSNLQADHILILYRVRCRLVTLFKFTYSFSLRVSDITVLTAGLKVTDFNFQTFPFTVSKMSTSFMYYAHSSALSHLLTGLVFCNHCNLAAFLCVSTLDILHQTKLYAASIRNDLDWGFWHTHIKPY